MSLMKYTRLGRSGLKVSQVCLGTMTFSREADEEASFAIMNKFVELGGTFLDTANMYAKGASEETILRIVSDNTSCKDAKRRMSGENAPAFFVRLHAVVMHFFD